MGFKTVGRYDESENYTGIFDFGAQMNKSLTEKFDERIKWVRGMDRAKRVETAQVCLAYIAQTVQEIMTDGEQLSDWLFTFLACTNELACAGLDPVPYAKKKELAEMLNLFGDEDEWLKKDMFFDWKQFRDKDHQMLVHSFLGICKDPGLHQYPDTVANYLLVACCADRPNENGIKAARHVWTEYLEYVRRVKRDPSYEYTGIYDRSHFGQPMNDCRDNKEQRKKQVLENTVSRQEDKAEIKRLGDENRKKSQVATAARRNDEQAKVAEKRRIKEEKRRIHEAEVAARREKEQKEKIQKEKYLSKKSEKANTLCEV